MKKIYDSEYAQRKAWGAANIEKVRAYRRKDYEINKEKIKAKNRARYNEDLAFSNKKKQRQVELYAENNDQRRATARKYRQANKAKVTKWRQDFKAKNRSATLIYDVRKRCKQKSLDFDLTVAWVQERFDKKVCEVTGIAFDMVGAKTPYSPSIDRIDAKLGYTQNNCRLIIWALNRALSNYGLEFMQDIFKRIKNG